MNAQPVRVLAAIASALVAFGTAAPARATDVKVPFIELGYRDGVTVAGVSPSVTFDLPRYDSLQAAVLHLELHVSVTADPASTISVSINGTNVATHTLHDIGNDARLTIPLPVPPRGAKLFAVTVSGALRVAGDPCANDTSRKLFLRIGRDSWLALRTTGGGTAEAFFRDYRGALDVIGGLDDPELVTLPYRLDRLEPWHRLTATLAAKAPKNGRVIELVANALTSRHGDVLRIAPGAFAALPVPEGQSPQRRAGSVAFRDLGQRLGSASGTGDLAFEVPLKGSITGGMPQRLSVNAVVQHSALPPGVSGTIQILVNGILVGARELDSAATTQTVSVAVPPSVVGSSNSVRVLIAPEIPTAACAGAAVGMSASLLDSSTFTWSGVVRKPPSIESYITALNGRVIVLMAPEFTRAAFRLLGSIGRLNAAITQLDVAPYTGTVPGGYDFAIVFAPPSAPGDLHTPLRTSAPAFALVNPTDNASVFTAAPDTPFALLQLGDAGGTPVLSVSYHGNADALDALERVRAAQLATQVADVTVVSGDDVTTYDVGEKLRPSYPGELTAAAIWSNARLWVAIALLILIVLGGCYAARRLTGRTVS